MLVDERKDIREIAARKMKPARQSNTLDSGEVRTLKVPSLNFDPDNLVNWQDLARPQPNMLKAIQ